MAFNFLLVNNYILFNGIYIKEVRIMILLLTGFCVMIATEAIRLVFYYYKKGGNSKKVVNDFPKEESKKEEA